MQYNDGVYSQETFGLTITLEPFHLNNFYFIFPKDWIPSLKPNDNFNTVLRKTKGEKEIVFNPCIQLLFKIKPFYKRTITECE